MPENTAAAGLPDARFRSDRHPLKAVMVFVTERCNLRCDYCYVAKAPRRMLPETARQCVDFLFAHADPAARALDICFFGGEPLLEPELIENTCRYALDRGREKGMRVRFSTTTNGTLLDEPRFRLLRDYAIDTTVSLDGDEATHDAHRKTAAGEGSFRLIAPNLARLAGLPGSTARLTVTPETASRLAASVRWLLEAGFHKVDVAPVFEAAWGEPDLLAYYEAWDEIYRRHDDMRKQGKTGQHVGNIDSLQQKLVSPGYKEYGCGAARNMVAADAAGNLYPCHRFIGYFRKSPRSRLGDVFRGFDPEKRRHYIASSYTGNHSGCGHGLFDDVTAETGRTCAACTLAWACGGSCLALNEFLSGDPRQPPGIDRVISQIHVALHLRYKCADNNYIEGGRYGESTKESRVL